LVKQESSLGSGGAGRDSGTSLLPSVRNGTQQEPDKDA
jgi:hypothetical protein